MVITRKLTSGEGHAQFHGRRSRVKPGKEMIQFTTSAITSLETCPARAYSAGDDGPVPTISKWFRVG